jgi:hypothetical protein
MASASDVPAKYDLVIAVPGGNTTGYVFDEQPADHVAVYATFPQAPPRGRVESSVGKRPSSAAGPFVIGRR